MKLFKKKFFTLCLVMLFTLPAVLPLLQQGMFPSDDGGWMIIRFSAFHQELRAGQFPVRFLDRLNYGYGYPVADFLYPGFMYLGEPFALLHFGFINTIKLLFALSLFASSVLSYLWLVKRFSPFAAFIGAMVYLYSPYHIYDLYSRGSMGEILSLGVLPGVLLASDICSKW